MAPMRSESAESVVSATRCRNLLILAVGAFFPASSLALVASNLFQVDHSMANIIAVYPILLILLPFLLLRHIVPRIATFYILLLLSLWMTLVFVSLSPINAKSFIRFMSLLLQVAYYLASFVCFYREPRSLITVWIYIACSTIGILLLANIINPYIGLSPIYVSLVRYEGITGPNSHGFISALSAITLLSLSGIMNRLAIRMATLIGALYALVNLWATGSRLSIVIFFVFLAIYLLLTSKSFWRFLWLFTLIVFGIAFLLYLVPNSVETAIFMFRLDQYSIKVRLQPVMWGLEKALQNSFWPYGLGTLAEEARINRLDNSYLYLLLELGFPALALVLGFVVLTVRHGLNLISQRDIQLKDRVLIATAIGGFVATALHGMGETVLLVGIQLTNLLFWVTAAFLSACFYKYRVHPAPKTSLGQSERSCPAAVKHA